MAIERILKPAYTSGMRYINRQPVPPTSFEETLSATSVNFSISGSLKKKREKIIFITMIVKEYAIKHTGG